jgi:competence protein ComEC
MSGRLKVVALLALASLVGALAALLPQEPTRLTFLSVGQGDCAVFQTSGHTVLIDVGPASKLSDGGKKIVVPDLRRMGIDSIDLILLSHPDMDHIGGLGAVLKSLHVGKIGLPMTFRDYQPLLQHLREAGCNGTEVVWLGPSQKVQVGDFTIEVDCPPWREGEPDNDGSEFVKLSGDKASAVFTGDADATTEAKMTLGHNWSAQVLKLGHHGSRTASSEAWLETVHPQWAIVSCGRNNTYGHPHPSVLNRVQQRGIKVARTDREGDIEFDLGTNGWQRTSNAPSQ